MACTVVGSAGRLEHPSAAQKAAATFHAPAVPQVSRQAMFISPAMDAIALLCHHELATGTRSASWLDIAPVTLNARGLGEQQPLVGPYGLQLVFARCTPPGGAPLRAVGHETAENAVTAGPRGYSAGLQTRGQGAPRGPQTLGANRLPPAIRRGESDHRCIHQAEAEIGILAIDVDRPLQQG